MHIILFCQALPSNPNEISYKFASTYLSPFRMQSQCNMVYESQNSMLELLFLSTEAYLLLKQGMIKQLHSPSQWWSLRFRLLAYISEFWVIPRGTFVYSCRTSESCERYSGPTATLLDLLRSLDSCEFLQGSSLLYIWETIGKKMCFFFLQNL